MACVSKEIYFKFFIKSYLDIKQVLGASVIITPFREIAFTEVSCSKARAKELGGSVTMKNFKKL